MTVRALIVDDEDHARKRLAQLLDHLLDVVVVACVDSGAAALESVRVTPPDVAFIDVDMPEVDGVALARMMSGIPVIFTTAHEQYAVDAFELGALDYLLKPLRIDRIDRALDRVRNVQLSAAISADGARRADAGPGPESGSSSPLFSARSGTSIYLFDPHEVQRFFARDKYSCALHRGRECLLERSLSQIHAELEQRGDGAYMRTHRSELVRVDAVCGLHQTGRGIEVELLDGQRAVVSRRMVTELKRRLGLPG